MNDTTAEVVSEVQENVTEAEAADVTENAQEDEQRTGVDDVNIDDLLSEFDSYQPTQRPQQQTQAASEEVDNDVPLTKADVDRLMQTYQQRQEYASTTERDIAEAVKTIKGDGDMPDHYIRGILEIEAQQNQKFQRAFAYRDQKPDVWRKIVNAKAKEVQKWFSPKSTQRSESMEKIAAEVNSAVKSATTEAPAPKKEMSNFEALEKLGPSGYERWRRQQIAKKA